jgi:hypothetical protein
VVDALSRVFEDPGLLVTATCSLISFPSATWLEELKLSYDFDPNTVELLKRIWKGIDVPKGYKLQHGLILKKSRNFIVKNFPFKANFLEYIHLAHR